jgi:hypothetical protein
MTRKRCPYVFLSKKTKNMKKILFSALAMLMLVACNQAPKNYTIIGTLDTDEFNGNWVYVAETLRKIATEPIDSAQIIDGKFQMQGVATEPLMSVAVITDANRKMTEQGVGTYFILENGKITMHVDTALAMTATGTELNRVYETYNDLVVSYDENIHTLAESELSNAEKFVTLMTERDKYKETLRNLVLPHATTQPGKELIKDIRIILGDRCIEFVSSELALLKTCESCHMMTIEIAIIVDVCIDGCCMAVVLRLREVRACEVCRSLLLISFSNFVILPVFPVLLPCLIERLNYVICQLTVYRKTLSDPAEIPVS